MLTEERLEELWAESLSVFLIMALRDTLVFQTHKNRQKNSIFISVEIVAVSVHLGKMDAHFPGMYQTK